VTGSNRWLKVLLKSKALNRSAIVAAVIASYEGRRQAQAVLAVVVLSASDRRLHFGCREDFRNGRGNAIVSESGLRPEHERK
jgi:hypothetical protein